MLCCLKCKRNTESIDPRVLKTCHGKTVLSSKCTIYGSKNQDLSKFEWGCYTRR